MGETSYIEFHSFFFSLSRGLSHSHLIMASVLFFPPLSEIANNHILGTAVFCLFRFVTGLCASAFFTVSGGTAGDMFSDAQVGKYVFFAIHLLLLMWISKRYGTVHSHVNHRTHPWTSYRRVGSLSFLSRIFNWLTYTRFRRFVNQVCCGPGIIILELGLLSHMLFHSILTGVGPIIS